MFVFPCQKDSKGLSEAFQRFGEVKSCATFFVGKNIFSSGFCHCFMVFLLLSDGIFKKD